MEGMDIDIPRDKDIESDIWDENVLPGPEGNDYFEGIHTGGDNMIPQPDTSNLATPEGRLLNAIQFTRPL